MHAHRLESHEIAPVGDWGQVTLQLTASDARRIVRALEETSVRLGGSPSGSRLASSYIRLAGQVRRQSAAAPPAGLAG